MTQDLHHLQLIRDADFAVPAEGVDDALLADLAAALRSPDPQVRDGLGYAILATWILRRQLSDEQAHSVGDQVVEHLRSPLPYVRSFAPLVLACLAEVGVSRHSWTVDCVSWWQREDDVHGYDPATGWTHTVAHGADFLGTAAERGLLPPRAVLDLAVHRMVRTTHVVWREREDERLALALVAALAAADPGDLDGWARPLVDLVLAGAGEPTSAMYSNTVRTVRCVFVDCAVQDGAAARRALERLQATGLPRLLARRD